MDSTLQTALTVGMPTLAILIGILVNDSVLSDLRSHIDSRLADMKETINARFGELRAELRRVEEVMDARIKHLEER